MPYIEVSYGELIDKWTILEIKLSALQSGVQVHNVEKEMNALNSDVSELLQQEEILNHKDSLLKINREIWNLMESLYEMGDQGDEKYVEITLNITKLNKDRAFVKRRIDEKCNSNFSEAKSYFEINGLAIE